MRTLLFLIVVSALFTTAFILFIAENRDPEVQRQHNIIQQQKKQEDDETTPTADKYSRAIVSEPPVDTQVKAVATESFVDIRTVVPSPVPFEAALPTKSPSKSPLLASVQVMDGLDITSLPDIPPAVVADAKSYISSLIRFTAEPLNIEDADNFVNQNQMLSLLQDASIEDLALDELLDDKSIRSQDPITFVREEEIFVPTTVEQLIAGYNGELKETIKVNLAGVVQEVSVDDILSKYTQNSEKPLLVAKKIRRFEVTTPKALARSGIAQAQDRVRFIRGNYKLQMATVADLIKEQHNIGKNAILYLRTVKSHDNHGLWGIIHAGLTNNFANGIGVRQSGGIENFQVDIPRYADEKIGSRSSFLGKLIYTKAITSFVYNFKEGRMGKSPDRIYPGQELVIISFEPEELVRIYHYFSNNNIG